jgi:hypothetical protein
MSLLLRRRMLLSQQRKSKNLFDIDNLKLVWKNSFSKLNYSPKVENGVLYSGGLRGSSAGGFIVIDIRDYDYITISFNADFDAAVEKSRVFEGYFFNSIPSDDIVTEGYVYVPINSANNIRLGNNAFSTTTLGYNYFGFAAASTTRYGVAMTNVQVENGKVQTEYEPF